MRRNNPFAFVLAPRHIMLSLLVSLMTLSLPVLAEDEVIELEGIFIQGNQEQPKVLFIMPWQSDAELSGLKQDIVPDLNSQQEHLDYFQFKRELEVHTDNEE